MIVIVERALAFQVPGCSAPFGLAFAECMAGALLGRAAQDLKRRPERRLTERRRRNHPLTGKKSTLTRWDSGLSLTGPSCGLGLCWAPGLCSGHRVF